MSTKTLNIGVNGASGTLGSTTLRALRERVNGERLTGISRTPEKVVHADDARYGDYDEPESLVSAYTGLDRLLIVPSADIRPGQRVKHSVAAIDAAVAAGVGHIVVQSSVGIYDAPNPDLFAAYYQTERHLIRTAPVWTVLRVNYYADAVLMETQAALVHGKAFGLAESRAGYVSRADVGEASAAVLLGEGHEGATYNLTGPARVSGSERAKALSESIGVPVEFRVVSRDALRSNFGAMNLPDDAVAAIFSIHENFARGAFDIVTGDVERLSGRPPRSLQEVLSQEIGGSR